MTPTSSPLFEVEERARDSAKLRVAFAARAERLRVVLRSHLEHGLKSRVAELSGCRLEQVSRQLSGDERLAETTVEASLYLMGDSAAGQELRAAIEMLREGRVKDFKVETKRAEVISFPGGEERIALS